MKTVAVTGARGMLGSDVVDELRRRGVPCVGWSRAELDVTDARTCRETIGQVRPAAVIHCAAYTDVNRAESEPDLAMRVNAEGTENVARACAGTGSRVVLVSTDYVFDGTKPEPYLESDPVRPLNAYGCSKLEGERRGLAAAPGHCAVARTSWLYGLRGKNFVTTMLSAARGGKPLKVVHDQTGAPTYTRDLARALVDLALAEPAPAGIFHVTNGGACTWYEFAQAIFELSGVTPADLKPCASRDFPTPAVRPANSRLQDTRLQSMGVPPLPPWRDALRRYLEEIGELRKD